MLVPLCQSFQVFVIKSSNVLCKTDSFSTWVGTKSNFTHKIKCNGSALGLDSSGKRHPQGVSDAVFFTVMRACSPQQCHFTMCFQHSYDLYIFNP